MNIATLLSLPAELCLKIFEYLSSFDLFCAFADLNNARLRQLAFSRPFALNANLIGYAQMTQISATPRFLAQLRSIALHRSLTADAFLTFWTQMITPTFHTPHLDRLLITNANDGPYTLVGELLQPLSSASNLRCIHLRFPFVTASYLIVLKELVRTATSFHTMLLECDQGMQRTCLSK